MQFKELNRESTFGELFKDIHTRKHDKLQWVEAHLESTCVNFELTFSLDLIIHTIMKI